MNLIRVPLACSVLIHFGLIQGSSKMGVREERERRLELLLMIIKACPDPEQALGIAIRMEKFISDGHTPDENRRETIQQAGQSSLEQPGKTRARPRNGAPGCFWPIGDPGDADLHFCGEVTVLGRPYCPEHCARAAYVSRTRDKLQAGGGGNGLGGDNTC